jgi:hypothetical protein
MFTSYSMAYCNISGHMTHFTHHVVYEGWQRKIKIFQKNVATLPMKNPADCPNIELDLHTGMPTLNARQNHVTSNFYSIM